MRVFLFGLVTGVTLLAAPASAQSNDAQVANCYNEGDRLDRAVQIRGCTAALGSAHLNAARRAIFYYQRGRAYAMDAEHVRAIADYSEAIRLNPQYARAYHGRGFSYDEQGDRVRAMADYNAAIRIDPQFADPYFNRALIYYEQGDKTRALATIRRRSG